MWHLLCVPVVPGKNKLCVGLLSIPEQVCLAHLQNMIPLASPTSFTPILKEFMICDRQASYLCFLAAVIWTSWPKSASYSFSLYLPVLPQSVCHLHGLPQNCSLKVCLRSSARPTVRPVLVLTLQLDPNPRHRAVIIAILWVFIRLPLKAGHHCLKVKGKLSCPSWSFSNSSGSWSSCLAYLDATGHVCIGLPNWNLPSGASGLKVEGSDGSYLWLALISSSLHPQARIAY